MTVQPIGTPEPGWEEQILRGVSRSFALTIPQLPTGLRARVANAYLLCRIIDTIEDEEAISLETKNLCFRKFIGVIGGDLPAEEFAAQLHPLLNHGTLPAERELVLGTAAVVKTFFSFSPQQQAIMRRCLQIMGSGMMRFQRLKNAAGLPDREHMNAYCYHVAGVVGEMLTELFCDYSEEIARHREAMLERAVSFGQGLQMTNILKDFWEDRERGACWLPRDLFQQAGCELRAVEKRSCDQRFGNALGELIGITHQHLKQALDYTLYIPPEETGLRRFCLWAVGMALATLQNLNRTRHYASGAEVKISRRKLKTIIAACNLAIRSDWVLRLLFKAAAAGLPLAGVSSPETTPAFISGSVSRWRAPVQWDG